MNIRTLIIFLLCSICASDSYAQEQFFHKEKTSLIGIKQLRNGNILMLREISGSSVALECITDKDRSWTREITVKSLGGYHFNRIQIHSSLTKVYFIDQMDEEALLWVLDAKTGNVLGQKIRIPVSVDAESEDLQLYGTDSSLYLVTRSSNELYYSYLYDLSFVPFKRLLAADEKYNEIYLRSGCAEGNRIYSFTYTLSKDHETMHLYLENRIPGSSDPEVIESDMVLDNLSFTYNSIFDKGVMAMSKGKDGFYLYGKLDMKFNGDYPPSKNSEGFIGFWIAKFDFDMRMIYFKQYPFRNLRGVVNQDAITKACVIDIKEDVNGGCFVVLNEILQVIHGDKYILYLDAKGDLKMSLGGRDSYNFFEYSKVGLRETGRASRMRLMNDDWSSYTSSSLHLMSYHKEFQSSVINNILYLAREENDLPDKMIFTYLQDSEGNIYILKYLKKRSGTLTVYKFSS